MAEGKYVSIGKRVKKIDGAELVRGTAQFTGDLRFPGMLFGFARRAGVPAGYIKSINVEKVKQMPGVVEVLLPKDIPGPNIIGIFPPLDQPLLAEKEIRYAAESVAFVVATSKKAAVEGARAIEVEIDELPPIISVDEALEDGSRKIHPNGNITFARTLTKGDVKKGFSEADVVLEDTFETSFQEHAYLEAEAVCAVPEESGRMTVYASCQSPFHIRGHIAANLAVPASRVRVIQAYTGGSFGGKDDVATEIGALAAVAARRCNAPVMVFHDRKESIIGSNFRHASRVEIKTGAKSDGTIVARQVKILLDGGAYASESPFVTMKALIHAAGPYSIEHVLVDSMSVYTNKTYSGACRGFGVPQVTFASESQMDELAVKLGIDPLELRIKNGLKPGDSNATGQVYEQSVGLRETQDKIKTLPPRKEKSDSRYLYGTGYCSMLQGISNGAEGIDVVGASVQLSQDGSVLVNIGLTELGQGSRTVYSMIASEVLGIPMENITLALVDTDKVHDSGPTVASRSTTVGGAAVKKAAEAVKQSLQQMAGLMLSTEPENIMLQDSFAVHKQNEQARIPIREVATAAYWTGFPLMNLTFSRAPDADYDHDTHQGNIYIAYNYGTHRIDVRVDSCTGEVKVIHHTAAHDVGKVINPVGLEGQVEGAALMGFGLAHLEKIIYEKGIVQNANFADYAVPSIKDRLPTETIAVEDPNPTGPYGAKGIGEPPLAGTAAAFANAVANATGIRFKRLPITKEDILAGLIEARHT